MQQSNHRGVHSTMQERPGQIGNYWLSQRTGSKNWCRTWFDAATRQTNRASLGTTDIQEAKVRFMGMVCQIWRYQQTNAPGCRPGLSPNQVLAATCLQHHISAKARKLPWGTGQTFLQVRQSQRLHRHGNVSLLGGYRREAIPSVATAI